MIRLMNKFDNKMKKQNRKVLILPHPNVLLENVELVFLRQTRLCNAKP